MVQTYPKLTSNQNLSYWVEQIPHPRSTRQSTILGWEEEGEEGEKGVAKVREKERVSQGIRASWEASIKKEWISQGWDGCMIVACN